MISAPYRLLFDEHPSPMWIVEPRTLRLLAVNDATVALYGYPRAELLARTVHALYAAGAAPDLEVSAAPRPARHVTQNGKTIDARVRVTRFDDDGREALLVVVADVTAEAALRESEARFRTIVENGADGVGIYRADGTTVYLSPAVTRMLGIKAEEMVGRPGAINAAPVDDARRREAYRDLLSAPGTQRRFETRTRHKDGSWRWVESVVTNLLDEPSVRGIMSKSRDVTDRKLAELALHETRARLEFLISATSAVTHSWRPSGDYGATFVSENVALVLGYQPRQFLEQGSFWSDHIHPDDRDAALASMALAVAHGRHAHEYRFQAGDGTWRWLHDELTLVRDELGEPKELIGCCFDITARREAEEVLRRSEMNFRALSEHLPSGILIHRDGRVVYANPALVRLLGYDSADELIGRPALDLAHPDDREAVRARIDAVRAGGRSPLRELRFVRRDGSALTAETEGLQLTYDGAPVVVVIARDLTERRELMARLALTDRMVSIGTLAAGVAHEVNNPLAYVTANLEVLSDALPTLLGIPSVTSRGRRLRVDDVPDVLRDAREGAARIRAVVGDLLALSRADHESTGPVDVRAVIESSVKMAGNEIRHRARLVLELDEVPPVEANASRLGQVFLNLFMNAAQAIPDGRVDEHEIRVRLRRHDDGVEVAIADTGCGIPREILGRIFDPFFTTKPLGVGTGLGLSICHGIVRSLGGELTASSEVGAGTTFRVVLPVAAARPERREPPPMPVARARRRVLVIDDEPAIGTSIARLLAEEHDVVAVTQAAEALARLERGEEYDAVLCDLMMPEMNGMALYATLAERLPRYVPRMVFLTGGAFTTAARDFLAVVAPPLVDKPFELAVLRAALDRVFP